MLNINKLNQNNNYTLGKPNIKTVWSNIQWNKTMQSSGDMGHLIPIDIKEMLPSEKYTVNYNPTVQFTPFVTNLMHEVTGEIYSGFVPNRLTMDRWQEFITGTDEEGNIINDGEIIIPKFQVRDVMAKIWEIDEIKDKTELANEWYKRYLEVYPNISADYKTTIRHILDKTIIENGLIAPSILNNATDATAKKIKTDLQNFLKLKVWGNKKQYLKNIAIFDYLEYPTQIFDAETILKITIYLSNNGEIATEGPNRTTEYNRFLGVNKTYEEIKEDLETIRQNWIIDLPIRAYNKFYNDWVRYFDWEPKRELVNTNIAIGKWAYDMYTRARRYQLRGAMPTVPVNIDVELDLSHNFEPVETMVERIDEYEADNYNVGQKVYYNSVLDKNTEPVIKEYIVRQRAGNIKYFEETGITKKILNHQVNIDNAGQQSNFSLFDFLTAGAIMNYYCNNAKIKPRYGEQLWARWGVSIQDARLQLAEFVNSQYFTITQNGIVQTSAQTSENSTLQGNITGQMWGNGSVNTTYQAQEHGYLVTIMLIKPKNSYERGVNTLLQKTTKWDFATPELANLPDRPIYKKEIAPLSGKDEILGYKSIYDEYRTDINTVTGILRPSLEAGLGAHTLARILPSNVTMQELVECKPDVNRIKQFLEQPDFIFSIQKQIIDRLPLPYETRPELNM